MVHKILCHPCALCLPVKPEPSGAVVNMIPAENAVDGRMHLNAADLSSSQILLIIDVMYVIVFNQGEDAAHMSDDSRLAAVVDIAPSYNM